MLHLCCAAGFVFLPPSAWLSPTYLQRDARPLFEMLLTKYASSLARDPSFKEYVQSIGSLRFCSTANVILFSPVPRPLLTFADRAPFLQHSCSSEWHGSNDGKLDGHVWGWKRSWRARKRGWGWGAPYTGWARGQRLKYNSAACWWKHALTAAST